MKNAIQKQQNNLSDKLLELSQSTAESKSASIAKAQAASDAVASELKQVNETLKKGLLNENSKSLNSNVIQLFKEVKKQTKAIEKMSPERAKEITEKSTSIEQFKTISERVENFQKGFKDFFTLKGFANKTGLVREDSGGIVSTAINRRAARMQYAEDRMRVDPNYWKLAKGETEEEKKATAKRTFEKQFDEQQKVRRSIRSNEAEISRLEKSGYTQEQIKRTGLLDARIDLATQMEKADSRVRVAKVTPEGKSKTVPAQSAESFSDETALEAQRSQEKVVSLLTKIEENTRGERATTDSKTEEPAKKKLGFLDGILESAFSFLKEGIMTALKFLFNPKNLLKIFTKVFVPAMIIGSLVNGIIDGFKAWMEGGDFSDVMISMLGGVLEFLTFGLIDKESLQGAIDWMGTAIDKYIVEPVKEFFSWIGGLFDEHIMQPILNITSKLYSLLDEYVIQPLAKFTKPITDFFKKLKDDIFSFLEDFGIPEISFTIPIIKKKVSIGPFYPFRPEEGTTRIASSTQLSQRASTDGTQSETMNQNIVTSGTHYVRDEKTGQLKLSDDKTQVMTVTSRQTNDSSTLASSFATFDPKTGKATLSRETDTGEEYDKEISMRAFRRIKKSAQEGGDAAKVDEIVREDEAYQKLGFFDKLKVDTGFAKATDLLAAKKPEQTTGTAVYNRSADNARAAMASQQQPPVIVNAPTSVNTTNKQNIAMPAPVRNDDNGFVRYISNTSYFAA